MSRLEQLYKLVELDPKDPMSHYAVGLEYVNLQRWEDAIAAFSRAIEVDAGYSAAYYHRGKTEISAGRTQEARNTLQAGIGAARAGGDMHTESEMRELLGSLD